MSTQKPDHLAAARYAEAMAQHCNVARKYPSNMVYGNGQPVHDRVEKEVYGVVDGKIVLIETKTGKHTPAYMVKETVTFDE